MIKNYMMAALVIFGLCCIFADGDRDSIENVDYAVSMSVSVEGCGGNSENSGQEATVTSRNEMEETVTILLYVANLIEYRGSSEQMLETLEYVYDVNHVEELFELYKTETGRTLSLSHIKKISLDGKWESHESVRMVLSELSDYVDISDELEVGGEGVYNIYDRGIISNK